MSSVFPRPRSRAILLAALALVPFAFALHGAPPARASTDQVSIMMDDNLLVYAPDSTRYTTLEAMRNLGVLAVRATLLWSVVAKGTKNPATHRRFDPTNPADYPRGAWANYDRLVEDAKALGMVVYFDVTGPGPAWAMGKTSDPTMKPSFMPNVGQFGKFVKAVGTRYSGSYQNIGRVSFWSLWNEPNQVGWLSPQGVYNSRLHAVLPYSPILYRELFYAGRRALNQTGHKTDTVLAGETAPLGSPPQNGRTPMRPGLFIREFFCVNSQLKPYTGLQASVRGCSFFKRNGPLQASGWAHHPYTKTEPPTWKDKSPDSIVIADISRLPKLLDAIANNTHRVAAGLPIWITEMGYESNPPDPYRGVSLADQASWIDESDYLAYQQPRVAGVTQFLYEDAGPDKHYKKGTRGYWGTYQSGLEFGPGSGMPVGSAKPAYLAYEMPIWIAPAGTTANPELELWAQVRFREAQVTPADALVFQFEPSGSSTWENVTPIESLNPLGFVDVTVPAGPYSVPGSWRAIWGNGGTTVFSRTVSYP
jgi:hypothetical protein